MTCAQRGRHLRQLVGDQGPGGAQPRALGVEAAGELALDALEFGRRAQMPGAHLRRFLGESLFEPVHDGVEIGDRLRGLAGAGDRGGLGGLRAHQCISCCASRLR